MKQKVIVTAATKYASVNEETGAITNGLSIEYIGDRIDEVGETYEKHGYYSFKESVTDVSLMSVVDSIPGVYEFNMVMKSNSKDRKPRLLVSAIKKLEDYKFPL